MLWALGGLGAPVRQPLRGVFFFLADFFAGQGEMGRAARNAGFAVRFVGAASNC